MKPKEYNNQIYSRKLQGDNKQAEIVTRRHRLSFDIGLCLRVKQSCIKVMWYGGCQISTFPNFLLLFAHSQTTAEVVLDIFPLLQMILQFNIWILLLKQSSNLIQNLAQFRRSVYDLLCSLTNDVKTVFSYFPCEMLVCSHLWRLSSPLSYEILGYYQAILGYYLVIIRLYLDIIWAHKQVFLLQQYIFPIYIGVCESVLTAEWFVLYEMIYQ